MKLSIFSDQSYLSQGASHVTMLYPFWGKNKEDPREPESGRYDRYTETGKQFFQMTPLEQADIAVLPQPWEHVIQNEQSRERVHQFIKQVSLSGKQTVVFFWHDSTEDVPLAVQDTTIFRTSFYRSHRKSNEFAMPAWSEDFVKRYCDGTLLVRRRQDQAIVGFCGYASGYHTQPHPTIKYYLKHLLLQPTLLRKGKFTLRMMKRILSEQKAKKDAYTDGTIRTIAVQALKQSPHVKTNFIIREHFLAGALLSSSEEERFANMHKARREYVQNTLESDYVLCARGGGNFSYRLYETLCCGRIPVFVDSDCVLPYDSIINWKEYCVWVDWKKVHTIGDAVATFHESLSDKQFRELQYACRTLWEEYLSPEGFFKNLYHHVV